MEIVAKILIAAVALEHLYILWMEMFAWETKGKEVFKAALLPKCLNRQKV
jgi:putative membrane protein